MVKLIRRRAALVTTAAAGALAAAAVLGTVIPASAGTATVASGIPTVRYEADNGFNWALRDWPDHKALRPSAASPYGDAGIVVNLHQHASDYNGITFRGYGPLAANLWVGDGSEAFETGNHHLSNPVDFSYGAINLADGSVQMFTGPHAGQTLSISQVQADFGSHPIFYWVGVVTSHGGVYAGVKNVNHTWLGWHYMHAWVGKNTWVAVS